jgi:sugar O-acyltransferase (sialic acid O-acetyltransferase NeuD family)
MRQYFRLLKLLIKFNILIMLIIGAKGFAKEVLEDLYLNYSEQEIVFYDDVSSGLPEYLYDKYKILKTSNEVIEHFQTYDTSFTIGIGNPLLRKKMYEKFINLGGNLVSTISKFSNIGSFGNTISHGCNIMSGTIITNDISIGIGCLINLNCTIGHNSIIGDFVEMSPGVHVSGHCNIGSYCNIGTNATLLPKVTLGKNVIVGAGSVVIKDVPDNCLVVGAPAVIKKELPSIEY